MTNMKYILVIYTYILGMVVVTALTNPPKLVKVAYIGRSEVHTALHLTAKADSLSNLSDSLRTKLDSSYKRLKKRLP